MNYEKDLVSIIIPTYNCKEYLLEAINNCLEQTYKKIKIIVIDDGSTDGTKEIIANTYKQNNIIYLYKTNGGLPSARNAGLKIASGEFVQFLDSDDLLVSTKIEKQVKFLKANKDMFGVYCGARYFKYSIDNVVCSKFIKHKGELYKSLAWGNFITVNSMLSRRIENFYFDETLKSFEDWDYWIRISEQKKKISYINDFLCYVRLHNNNMSRVRIRMVKNEVIVLEKMKKKGRYLDRINYVIFKENYRSGNKECWEYLYESFKYNPFIIIKALLFMVYSRAMGDKMDPYK